MVTIQGIFDGKHIIPLEVMPEGKRFKVIITFVEEITEEEDVRNFSAQSNAFDFWENPAEDIYQDFLAKSS